MPKLPDSFFEEVVGTEGLHPPRNPSDHEVLAEIRKARQEGRHDDVKKLWSMLESKHRLVEV